LSFFCLDELQPVNSREDFWNHYYICRHRFPIGEGDRWLIFFVLMNYSQLIREKLFGIMTIYVRTDSHSKDYSISFQLNRQQAIAHRVFFVLMNYSQLIREKLFGITTIYVGIDSQ
jgi:hypothetical protein